MKHIRYTLSFLYLILLVLCTAPAFAQSQGSIRGFVKTSDGSPASFVNVNLKNTRRGTTTLEDGGYQLKGISAGTYTLQVSFVGLQTQEKLVTVKTGRTNRG